MKGAFAFCVCSVVRVGVLAMVLLLARALPAAAQSETVEYYGLDALGSVRVIVDPNGQPIDRMDYGPFGENLKASVKFAFEQFAQLARDGETGQDYAHARNYSPATGRLNGVDPVYAGLFNPQLWNRYAYALNNPVAFVDPNGLLANSQENYCWTWSTNFSAGVHCTTGYGTPTGGIGGSGSSVGRLESNPNAAPTGGQPRRGVPSTPAPTPPSSTPPQTPPTPVPAGNNPGATPPGSDPPADKPNKLVENMQCAALGAEGINAAWLFGIDGTFIGDTVGSNDLSALSNLAVGPHRMSGGVGYAASKGIEWTARGAMHAKVMQEHIALKETTWGTFESVKYFDGTAAATKAGRLAMKWGARLSGAKMIYDVATYLGTFANCASR